MSDFTGIRCGPIFKPTRDKHKHFHNTRCQKIIRPASLHPNLELKNTIKIFTTHNMQVNSLNQSWNQFRTSECKIDFYINDGRKNA